MAIGRVCEYGGCGQRFDGPGNRCSAHSTPTKREDTRPSAEERGYTREWSKIRAEFLRNNPSCVRCGLHNDLIVHHKLPLVRGGSHAIENLVTLCRSCHGQIHEILKYQ